MIENLLAEALREKIAEAVKDFRLLVKNGESRSPKIINSYLPPKRSDIDDDFPFVIVRPESGESDRDLTITTVVLVIGCYSKENDGHEYCLNVMTKIRTALMSMENETLANKYQLDFPIKWETVPEQPIDYWQVGMTTKWRLFTPKAVF